MRVRLVFTKNPGRGLLLDIQLLTNTIEALGHQVICDPQQRPSHTHVRLSNKWYYLIKRRCPATLREALLKIQRKARNLGWHGPHYDLTIHLENVQPNRIQTGSKNWLIPNQEWFPQNHLHYLSDFDQILCKTKEADRIFKKYHPKTRFISFSSPRIPPEKIAQKNTFQKFLHIAGRSRFKGTLPIIEAWEKHPGWPTLELVCEETIVSQDLPPNVNHRSNLSVEEIQELWSKAEIVLIPSEVEGFGQVLLEALAHGTVLITTNAPPMNELVTKERGFHVEYEHRASLGMGTRYLTTAKHIEQTIQSVMDTPQVDLQTLARRGRYWVENNHKFFLTEFTKLIKELEKHHNKTKSRKIIIS